jgi:hypothetical protein
MAGPRVYSYEELVRTIARTAGLRPVLMRMPFAFWGALAGLAEILPHPPLTRNQVELMQIVGSCNARPIGSARPIFRCFSQPNGEAALVSPGSVSWRVFNNPLSLFIGDVTAVVMELAEPRVRTGVWEHTNFREDPIQRLRRTGLAAMVTVYGARSTAEAIHSPRSANARQGRGHNTFGRSVLRQ